MSSDGKHRVSKERKKLAAFCAALEDACLQLKRKLFDAGFYEEHCNLSNAESDLRIAKNRLLRVRKAKLKEGSE